MPTRLGDALGSQSDQSAQVFSETRVNRVDIGPLDSSGEKHPVNVDDVFEEIFVCISNAEARVVFFTFFVVIVLTVEHHGSRDRVITKVGADNDPGISVGEFYTADCAMVENMVFD
jgi:hypothetical protein